MDTSQGSANSAVLISTDEWAFVLAGLEKLENTQKIAHEARGAAFYAMRQCDERQAGNDKRLNGLNDDIQALNMVADDVIMYKLAELVEKKVAKLVDKKVAELVDKVAQQYSQISQLLHRIS